MVYSTARVPVMPVHYKTLTIWLISACLFFLLPSSAAPYEVYKYTAEEVDLLVYPLDLSLSMQQKHRALHSFAEKIQQETTGRIADFARISLYEMAALYEEEARRIWEYSDIRRNVKYARWRDATLSHAQHLYHVADLITPATSIELYMERTGELHLLIENVPFILSSPLIHDPYRLDERIIHAFCQVEACDPDVLAFNGDKNTRTVTIMANWVMTEGRPPEFVTNDGLHFIFSSIENRPLKQSACLRVIREIRLLVDTLKDARSRGIFIDWKNLDIRQLHGSYDYRIIINPFGDSLYMKFPELGIITGWPEKILAWLHAQVENEPFVQYFQGDELLGG
jgi:hypothetical protein